MASGVLASPSRLARRTSGCPPAVLAARSHRIHANAASDEQVRPDVEPDPRSRPATSTSPAPAVASDPSAGGPGRTLIGPRLMLGTVGLCPAAVRRNSGVRGACRYRRPMKFKGWPPTATEFFVGLEAENTKAYWLDHKDVYERDVKAPMEALLAELRDEFGESRVFRPYRDTRFSADKTPYKTAVAARVGDGYVHFSADGLLAGAGTYHMAPDQLARYRDAVVAERPGRKLESAVAAARCGRARRPCPRIAEDGAPGLPQGAPAAGAAAHEGPRRRRRDWPPASWQSHGRREEAGRRHLQGRCAARHVAALQRRRL